MMNFALEGHCNFKGPIVYFQYRKRAALHNVEQFGFQEAYDLFGQHALSYLPMRPVERV
jgi:hypothetical protein